MSRRPGSVDPPSRPAPRVVLAREVPGALSAAAVRAGRWERIRPGAFLPVDATLGEHARRERRALARVLAADAQLRVDHVISHQSAALLWGLPLVGDGSAVHLIQEVSPKRGAPDLRRHRHRLGAGDAVMLGGRRVTSLARTVADCAALLPAPQGMVLADAALRRGLDRGECLAILERNPRGRGARKAAAVVGLADDGAESPGESRLRCVLLRCGLPAPVTQVRVSTAEGDAWGDLGWPGWRLLAEYDGVAKYTAGSAAAAEVVLRERRREAMIEREGWRVVRATAADLRTPRPLLTALLRVAPAGTRERLEPRIWLM